MWSSRCHCDLAVTSAAKAFTALLTTGSFAVGKNWALMTLTTGPRNKLGWQTAPPSLNPWYKEYTSLSQLYFLQTKPHSISLGFCFNSNGLVAINFTDTWTSPSPLLPPLPANKSPSPFRAVLEVAAPEFPTLDEGPNPFWKPNPHTTPSLKWPQDLLRDLLYIWFRPPGLRERRSYGAVWFIFMRVFVSLPCSHLAMMSINCTSGIFQTVLIYGGCC